jgi:hypothetical protein
MMPYGYGGQSADDIKTPSNLGSTMANSYPTATTDYQNVFIPDKIRLATYVGIMSMAYCGS